MNTVPILEHEGIPGKLLQTPNGETVLDFGQNIAGYVEFMTARAGQKVKLTCGEALDENGNFTQENFQDRARHKEGGTAQMLELVCKEGENHFKPHYTALPLRQGRNRRFHPCRVYRPCRLLDMAGDGRVYLRK